jgi:hypothetical protein
MAGKSAIKMAIYMRISLNQCFFLLRLYEYPTKNLLQHTGFIDKLGSSSKVSSIWGQRVKTIAGQNHLLLGYAGIHITCRNPDKDRKKYQI